MKELSLVNKLNILSIRPNDLIALLGIIQDERDKSYKQGLEDGTRITRETLLGGSEDEKQS